MLENLKPIENESLKNKFIRYFENLILSGEFTIGTKLPPERELAKKLKISRPIIHEGLLELEKKGLVKIIPRKGTFSNNYLKEGSLELLEALLHYNNYKLDNNLLESFLEIRLIFEKHAASKAALNRSNENLKNLNNILKKELEIIALIKSKTEKTKIDKLRLNIDNKPISINENFAKIDFEFHFEISLASGNFLFPLLSNSFKKVYISILSFFYSNKDVIEPIYNMHKKLIKAISDKKPQIAENIMEEILLFGEKKLKEIYYNKKN